MFALSAIAVAVVLTGSLLGSSVAFVSDMNRRAKARRDAETNYSDVLGPAFAASRVKPVRVTYMVAKARAELAALEEVEALKIAA